MRNFFTLILILYSLVCNARPPETGWYEFNNPFDFDELLFEKDFLELMKQKEIRRMTIGVTDYFFTENRVDSIIRKSANDENWKITFKYDDNYRLIVRDDQYFYLNNHSIDSIVYDSEGFISSVTSWWIQYKGRRIKRVESKSQESDLVAIENKGGFITYFDSLNHNKYVYDKSMKRFTSSKRVLHTIYGKTVIDSISYSQNRTQFYYKFSENDDFVLGQEILYNEQGKVIKDLKYQAESDLVKYDEEYYYNSDYKLIRKDSFKYSMLRNSESYYYIGHSGLLDCVVEIYPGFVENEEIYKSEISSCKYY